MQEKKTPFSYVWSVLLFMLLCFGFYEAGAQSRQHSLDLLMTEYNQLRYEKEKVLALQSDLKLQIASQSDRDSVELILMQKLGLVPEGQKKVVFESSVWN